MTTTSKKTTDSKAAGKPSTPRTRTAKTAASPRKGAAYKSAAKTKTAAATPLPTTGGAGDVVTETQPAVIRADMKKRELISEVVTRSGIKKRDVKPSVEAALAILGEALADGRELNLPPLGKVKINRIKKSSRGQVIVAKVRQITAAPDNSPEDAPDPLAQAAE